MKVFFVRHGETNANHQLVHQSSETPLSELGQKQADFLGRRLANLPITHGLCSTHWRAKQTAEIINRHHPIKFEYTPDLVELAWPSSVLGKSYHDQKAEKIKRLIDQKRREDESFRYEDEETFAEVRDRIKRLKSRLEQHHSDDQILVISHGWFIKSFFCQLLHGERFTFEQQHFLKYFLELQNTGITVFEYTQRDWHPWQLITWNDHAHL